MIDTNTVDDQWSAMTRLRDLHEAGWIDLTRTDTMDTELLAAGEDKRDGLLGRSSAYVEHLGPLVLGHSRLDSAVLGSQSDVDRLDHVFATLFPGAARATSRRNHVRDAMHVATAIRYGANGFITNDRRLLNKRTAVQATFDGFLIYSPQDAVQTAERFVARARKRGVT